jgi:hypothetical protein
LCAIIAIVVVVKLRANIDNLKQKTITFYNK